MISTIFEYTGKLIGETVHQTGKLAEATWDGTKSLAEDIADAPSAFMKGYEEELFEADKLTEPTSTSNIVTTVQNGQV